MSIRYRNIPKLTDGDKEVFAKARATKNPSVITNYYLRNADSGTYWRLVKDEDISILMMEESIAAAMKWRDGYNLLLDIWKHLKKPEFFGPDAKDPTDWKAWKEEQYQQYVARIDRVYHTTFDPDTNDPVFHHPHGKLLLPWHLEMNASKHPIQTVIGGFGSAKTYGKTLIMLTRAITLPGYRALALAPFGMQAEEVHTIALQMIEGTYFEKFLLAAPVKPNPKLIFGNDMVGVTRIECFSGDKPGKFLTLTIDEAMIDQAEKMDGVGTATIEELVRSLGTRMRGMVNGRPRVGQMTFVANSADNPQLWDLYDEAETDPDYVYAKTPATHDNTYLTIADLFRYEKQVGKTDTDRKVHMLGERPIGSGEHFNRENLEKCHARYLDEMMTENLNKRTPGWVREEGQRVAVYRWERPYDPTRRYIVAADTGWANPPDRNSPVVAAWDITDFPRLPMMLAAFFWVSGNASPNPWIAQYQEYVLRYHAKGFNGYDATGPGAGYERMDVISNLMPSPVNMGGTNKMAYLNLTKKLVADGKFQVPSIAHLFSQCAKYRLPDDNLRQDIVSMLFVTAALVESMALYEEGEGDPPPDFDPDDRYWRSDDRADDGRVWWERTSGDDGINGDIWLVTEER